MQETLVQFLVKKICWRRDRLPTAVFLGFPCGSAGEEFTCNAGDLGLIPGLGRSLGEGKSYPLQYSGLDNSLDCIVHGVAKSRACFEKLAGTNNIYSWQYQMTQGTQEVPQIRWNRYYSCRNHSHSPKDNQKKDLDNSSES